MLLLSSIMLDMSFHFKLICCVYIISRVISSEDIFEPLRNHLMENEDYFFYGLISCFFCLSCWVSLLTGWWFNVNIFVLIVGANFLRSLILEAF